MTAAWAERIKLPDLLALGGVVVALAVAAALIVRSNRAPTPVQVTAAEPDAYIKVHVTGRVIWPGLYELKAGSRTQDAIWAARGPTYDADLARLNLAAPLRDGDRVVVPKIVVPAPEPEPRPPVPLRSGRSAAPAAVTERAGAGGGAARSDTAPAAGEPAPAVNVNIATAADLERLPGVGPVLARRIVEHREAKGLFRQLDDLLQVKGIGPRLYARLKPHLSLE
jgi:competence protein ComEA